MNHFQAQTTQGQESHIHSLLAPLPPIPTFLLPPYSHCPAHLPAISRALDILALAFM